ncbi:response regulator [Candidatus Bipolaricaulota sp. J31]
MRILIVEDDPDSLEMLQVYLESRGHEVIAARDGVEALRRFRESKPDLILLDIMMPRMDGWDVLATIRGESDVPIIMVTARDSTEDLVRGLSAGVDDYVTKPFKLREVEARIEAVMRRYRSQDKEVLRVGELVIDDRRKEVRLRDRVINLSPKEYELLKLLASDPGRVFSDQEILRRVWPEGSLASSNDVKRYIHLLRQKLGDDPKNPKLILTVRGFGYRLG